MTKIAPSLLAADFTNLESELTVIKSADYLHLDIMDGNFVPNISFGFDIIGQLRRKSDLYFDVHLMIDQPERYITNCLANGADLITIHIEAVSDATLRKIITDVHLANKAVGVAIKPDTAIERITPYLAEIDLVLVMSVEPGFGGQEFQTNSLTKVKKLKLYREQHDYSYQIEIDGGINQQTGSLAIAAGVDILVAGSFIFKGDAEQNIIKLKGDSI